MTAFTSLKSVNISGNNISSTSTNNYDKCLYLVGDATVTNNKFAGCVGNGTTPSIVEVVNSGNASIISNNIFIRSTTNIATYILCDSGAALTITNNVFDSPEVASGNDVLVTYAQRNIYHSNKNQTEYKSITIGEYVPYLDGDPTNYNVNAPSASAYNFYYSLFPTNNQTGAIEFPVDLDKYLPENVNILGVKAGLGFLYFGTGTDPSGNNLNVIVTSSATNAYNATTYALTSGNILDYSYAPTLTSTNNTATFNSVTSNQIKIATVDLTSAPTNTYIVNDTMKNVALVQLQFNMAAAGGGAEIRLTPIVVKYRWQ